MTTLLFTLGLGAIKIVADVMDDEMWTVPFAPVLQRLRSAACTLSRTWTAVIHWYWSGTYWFLAWQIRNVDDRRRAVGRCFRLYNKLCAWRHNMPLPLQVDNIFVFIRQVAPVPACWLFKTSATSWPLTFWSWKWCLSHVWCGLPLCQF